MGRKIKIVRINGFRIPGLEYPSKPLEDLLELKNDDTELVVRNAPDAFVRFVEQNYENSWWQFSMRGRPGRRRA